MAKPCRIQLSRRKGFNLQATSLAINGLPAANVARPSKWGNPFKIGATVHKGPAHSGRDELVRDAAHACVLYREWLFNQRDAEDKVHPLAGKNLACFCPLDQPCHADILLRVANP